jgi:hypothetical protein
MNNTDRRHQQSRPHADACSMTGQPVARQAHGRDDAIRRDLLDRSLQRKGARPVATRSDPTERLHHRPGKRRACAAVQHGQGATFTLKPPGVRIARQHAKGRVQRTAQRRATLEDTASNRATHASAGEGTLPSDPLPTVASVAGYAMRTAWARLARPKRSPDMSAPEMVFRSGSRPSSSNLLRDCSGVSSGRFRSCDSPVQGLIENRCYRLSL